MQEPARLFPIPGLLFHDRAGTPLELEEPRYSGSN
jgi:hypothetical protein